jgi:hypothetical protein
VLDKLWLISGVIALFSFCALKIFSPPERSSANCYRLIRVTIPAAAFLALVGIEIARGDPQGMQAIAMWLIFANSFVFLAAVPVLYVLARKLSREGK